MPIIKRRIVKDGAIVIVSVGWSEVRARKLRLAKRAVPGRIHAKAMIDTGADITCVDPKLIEELDIPMKGYLLANVPALQDTTFVSHFDVSLHILHPSKHKNSDFMAPNLAIMELSLGMVGYQVLLGRDVLSKCAFLYDGVRRRFALKY